MSDNTFGHLFRVTTWGESHGRGLGCVVDGCPPGIQLDEAMIQQALDRRRPGQSRHTTQRREPDQVAIWSGVFEGVTTGTPISLIIENQDQRSKDYSDIKDKFRPGHADYAYIAKYGTRDYRGGGRQSARETAARVAAGGVAEAALKNILGENFAITGALVGIGDKRLADDIAFDSKIINDNPLFCPDAAVVPEWETYLDEVRKSGSSIGAVIEVRATGIPAGLGAPIYGKLDTELAAAMMSINAVKGVEIGNGMAAAALRGEQNADEMRLGDDGTPRFTSNKAGGVLGGISTGQDVVVRFAVKPTSSILTPRDTIDRQGNETEIITKGRHDPCVGIRAVPVGEAMMACTLLDQLLRHRGQTGRNGPADWHADG
ncbi:MAG: chorismate synthase [Alphaproteobacteria bacterium]